MSKETGVGCTMLQFSIINDNVGVSGSSFTQTLGYDAFNNLTSRSSQTYSLPAVSFPASGDSVNRDAADNVVASSSTAPSLLSGKSGWHTDTKLWNYDAAGRMQRWEEDGPWGAYEKRGGETAYDGDGRAVKRVDLQKL